MRLHTVISHADLHMALRQSGAPAWFEVLTEHRSATHDRAFEVKLTGSNSRLTNPGTGGGDTVPAATWDEWGALMGAVYLLDASARWGWKYLDADHFHHLTGNRFRSGTMPADTHPNHVWRFDGVDTNRCTKCSATMPASPVTASPVTAPNTSLIAAIGELIEGDTTIDTRRYA